MNHKQENKRKRANETHAGKPPKRQKALKTDNDLIEAFTEHYQSLGGNGKKCIHTTFSKKFDVQIVRNGIFASQNIVKTFRGIVKSVNKSMEDKVFHTLISMDGFEFSYAWIERKGCHEKILQLYENNLESIYDMMQALSDKCKIPAHKRFTNHGFDTGYVLEKIDNIEQLRRKSVADIVPCFQGRDLKTCYILCTRFGKIDKREKHKALLLFDEQFSTVDFKQNIYGAQNPKALLFHSLDLMFHEESRLKLFHIFLRPNESASAMALDSRSLEVCQGIEQELLSKFSNEGTKRFRRIASEHLYSKDIVYFKSTGELTKAIKPVISESQGQAEKTYIKKQYFFNQAPVLFLREEEYSVNFNPEEITLLAVMNMVRETTDFSWLNAFCQNTIGDSQLDENIEIVYTEHTL